MVIYDRNDSTIIIYNRNDGTIVIYDRNDSTIVIYDRNHIYYKTTIVTNLASDRSINDNCRILIYDRKERYKLKHNLLSYKTF